MDGGAYAGPRGVEAVGASIETLTDGIENAGGLAAFKPTGIDPFLLDMDAFIPDIDVFMTGVGTLMTGVEVFVTGVEVIMPDIDAFAAGMDAFVVGIDAFAVGIDAFAVCMKPGPGTVTDDPLKSPGPDKPPSLDMLIKREDRPRATWAPVS